MTRKSRRRKWICKVTGQISSLGTDHIFGCLSCLCRKYLKRNSAFCMSLYSSSVVPSMERRCDDNKSVILEGCGGSSNSTTLIFYSKF
jgi:hypothetical protein